MAHKVRLVRAGAILDRKEIQGIRLCWRGALQPMPIASVSTVYLLVRI
jgi:hypothetical protein